jgi:hypothetical protein
MKIQKFWVVIEYNVDTDSCSAYVENYKDNAIISAGTNLSSIKRNILSALNFVLRTDNEEEVGLNDLKKRPLHYKNFNAPNGWGTYKHFVPFVEKYLNACKEHPDATIDVSR